jgi:hypothetical protein
MWYTRRRGEGGGGVGGGGQDMVYQAAGWGYLVVKVPEILA